MAEDLLLRLIAENQAFERRMKQSRNTTKGLGKDFETLKTMMVGGLGFYGVKRAFADVTQAAMVQEKAEQALSAALKQTGDFSQKRMADLKAYASQMQKQTVYGDEVLLQQMAYAKNLGIETTQLKAVTKAAIGLSEKYGKDLSTSYRLLALASKGETGQLKEMGIILDQTRTKQEQFNELMGIGTNAFSLVKENADTAAFAISQYQNAVSDLKEELGFALIKHLKLTEAMRGATYLIENKGLGVTADEMRLQTLDKRVSTIDKIRRGKAHNASSTEMQMWGLDQPYGVSDRDFTAYLMKQRIRWNAERNALREKLFPTPKTTPKQYQALNELNGAISSSVDAVVGPYTPQKEVQAHQEKYEQMDAHVEAYYKHQLKMEAEVKAKREQNISFLSNSMADATLNMMRDSKNWKEHSVSMVQDVIAYYIKLALVKQFAGIFSGFGSGGSYNEGIAGGGNYSFMSSTRNFGNHQGNAFSNGRIIPHFKGDVIGTSSWFPMAGGNIGTLAEKGPEAIMPLERDSHGDLGVKMIGGGGVAPTCIVNVTNTGTAQDTTATVSQEQGQMIINIVNQDLASNGKTARTVKTIAAQVR